MTRDILKKILGLRNVTRINRMRNIYRDILRTKTYNILIDTTNGCNLRCIFCTRSSHKIVRMKASEFDQILTKLRSRISTLQLSCAWEYSIANDAAEIVKVLGKYKIPYTTIYTNSNLLSDDLAEAIIEAMLNDFVISIGEARKETYERIRKGGNFERVLANIRKLDRLKKERNSKYPRLCANLTLINSNIGELIEFLDLAHNLGIEEIRGRHLILNKGLDINSEIISDKAYANSIIESAHKRATKYRMSFSIPRYSEQIVPKSCWAPWHQLYISSNGDVSVCPRIHLYIRIGNLLNQDLKSVIRSNEMKDLRNQFNKGEFKNEVCGICMSNKESEIPIDQGF
jgi:radical SAM protein with 4Fe4S-binding SPASM domain